VASVQLDGALVQFDTQYGLDIPAAFAYAYGTQTIDTFGFTVLADGQVQLDVLSWQYASTWIDSVIWLFDNDGNPPTAINLVDSNDDGPELGMDLNNSLSPSDSFLDIFLPAGEYTVAIGAFLSTVDDVASGEGLGLVWDGGGNGLPTMGQYRIDIFGDVQAASKPCLADLTGEGDLNFLDVSAFLAAFGNSDPAADFTGEGDFNFLDVSAFLAAFGVGCP
jgi:hypothetical protein